MDAQQTSKSGLISFGGSSSDPILALLSTFVGLPFIGFLSLFGPSALGSWSCSLPEAYPPNFTVLVVLALASAWVLFPALNKVFRLLKKSRRCSVALCGLKGPSYGLLGVLPISRRRPDVHRLITDWAERFGPIIHVRFLLIHVVIVTDPVLAKHILRSKALDKFRFLYHILDPFLGGLNVLTGPSNPHWRPVRKGVSPAFNAMRMRSACEVVVKCAIKLANILTAAGPEAHQNVDNLLLRESMDVLGLVGFNKDMGALDSVTETSAGTDKAEILLKATHETMQRYHEPWRERKLWRSDVRNGNRMLASFHAIIKHLMVHMKQTVPAPGSFAQLLMASDSADGSGPLIDEAMLPEVAALFFAGTDTTGHTGTWIL